MSDPLPVGDVVPDGAGLCSLDGGIESPDGPIEKRGICLGWAEMPASSVDLGAEVGGCVCWSGEMVNCGVIMSPRALATAERGFEASREPVTEGVRGGECTADCGGECRGEGAAEPAGICRGKRVCDGTCRIVSKIELG